MLKGVWVWCLSYRAFFSSNSFLIQAWFWTLGRKDARYFLCTAVITLSNAITRSPPRTSILARNNFLSVSLLGSVFSKAHPQVCSQSPLGPEHLFPGVYSLKPPSLNKRSWFLSRITFMQKKHVLTTEKQLKSERLITRTIIYAPDFCWFVKILCAYTYIHMYVMHFRKEFLWEIYSVRRCSKIF